MSGKLFAFFALLAITAGVTAFLIRRHWQAHDPPNRYQQLVEPSYLPPPVNNTHLRPLVDRRLKEGVRLQAIASLPDQRLFTEADVAALVVVLKDPHENDTVRNEVATLLRDAAYEGLASDLLDILESDAEAERFRFFAAQHYGEAWLHARASNKDNAPQMRDVLRQLLAKDHHALVRQQALLVLGSQGDKTALAKTTDALTAAKDGPLIDTAMRIAADRQMESLYPHIRRRAHAEDPFVRRRAIASLGALRDEASRSAIEAAANSNDESLAQAANLALEQLNAARETSL